jgi:hypothetical protein
VDTGRDVVKMTSMGIRDPKAAFDPDKIATANRLATILPLGAAGVAASYSFPENIEK